MTEEPLFFETPSAFREWLTESHDRVEVQWIGFYKVHTGKPSITWPESVEEALCFGWIDGLRKSIDDERYMIRFTPRKQDSHWSRKNIETVERLEQEGRLHAAGRKAYANMDENNAMNASYEREEVTLSKKFEEKIKSNAKAWRFFRELAPSYTKVSVHWVMSAKREDTRLRRLEILIESCEEEKKIPPLRRGG